MFGCGDILNNILMNKASTSCDLDSFYPVKPECKDNGSKIHFRPRAGKTLSARRWHAAFSEDGHLDIAKMLRRIQRGGVHPSIKDVVWEFLLGCYDPNSTFDERNVLRQRRRNIYNAWKAECHAMVPVVGSGNIVTSPIVKEDGEQVEESVSSSADEDNYTVQDRKMLVLAQKEKKVLQWMRSLHQIGLDVVRTDRSLAFYESEDNRAKLWNILAIYAWMDKDVGYMQGMNDICSPMVVLFENEADAFWCFERAMRRLRDNFKSSTSSIGVQSQLTVLSEIIKAVDPKLHQHLEDVDGGEYLFAFRMLMVLFRREFSFVDALHLWELMWAMEYNPNIFSQYAEQGEETGKSAVPKLSDKELKQYGKFERNNMKNGNTDQHNAFAVFLVASVLETKNKRFLKEAKGLDDVVKILSDITGNLDAKRACKEALKIQEKYLSKAKKSCDS